MMLEPYWWCYVESCFQKVKLQTKVSELSFVLMEQDVLQT